MIGNHSKSSVDELWRDNPTQADLVIPWHLHGDIVVMSLDRDISVSNMMVELIGDPRALLPNPEHVRSLATRPMSQSTQDLPVDEWIEWSAGLEFDLKQAAYEADVSLNDLVVGLLWNKVYPESEVDEPKPVEVSPSVKAKTLASS